MPYPLLDRINSPQELKKLFPEQLPLLCQEIRDFLIHSVSRTGGHLASNLGTVELTVALHYVLNTPQDKFVFDVGHQCYTHKLLTGRRSGFEKLRQEGGLSGFPSPSESEHDAFVAGHGNTAISAAIGMAQAKKLKGEPGKVVALVGDGAFTGGMVYEGMNNVDTLNNLIVILNDNKMSISKNVGSVARYLTVLRTNPQYNQAKARMETFLDHIPVLGEVLVRALQACKRALRRTIYHSTMFEEMGFQYIGPVDGHDTARLVELLQNLQNQVAPVFLHVVTVKGKGFKPAEENPGEFHGVSSFDTDHLPDPDVAPAASFSTRFGMQLVRLAEQDGRICAITAAMKYGTGLQYMYRRFPERFFDVGMAEQHAVTFAAGLASQGLLPVVGIYSTFLQRSFDQVIHDVRLMGLNVLFDVDRAGLVPGDGETHQGIYDPAYLSQAGVPVWSPCNYAELDHWLAELMKEPNGPRAIRYPRGGETPALAALGCSGKPYDQLVRTDNAAGALISYGSETADVLEAGQQLAAAGQAVDVYKLVQIYPLPDGLVRELGRYDILLFAEECVATGGIGQQLQAALLTAGWHGRFIHRAVTTNKIDHADVSRLKAQLELDAAALRKSWEDL